MTYILVAIAPDGTREPLSREQFDGWNARSRTKVARADAHQMSKKRANQERNRMLVAGLLLLAAHLPPDEAVAELRRVRPTAWPNRRIVGFGDELLGLRGELVAADMRWRTIRDRDGIPGYEAAP